MAEYQLRYSMAGCPMCGHYGPHFEAPGDTTLFSCRLCEASFGVGRGAILTMPISDPVPHATTSS